MYICVFYIHVVNHAGFLNSINGELKEGRKGTDIGCYMWRGCIYIQRHIHCSCSTILAYCYAYYCLSLFPILFLQSLYVPLYLWYKWLRSLLCTFSTNIQCHRQSAVRSIPRWSGSKKKKLGKSFQMFTKSEWVHLLAHLHLLCLQLPTWQSPLP